VEIAGEGRATEATGPESIATLAVGTRRPGGARPAIVVVLLWVLVTAAGATYFVYPVLSSKRPPVSRDLLFLPPAGLPVLDTHAWRPFPDGSGQTVLGLEWASEKGSLVHEEVHVLANPVSAYYFFLWDNPKRPYVRELGRLVQDTAVPKQNRADTAAVYCANKGRSTMSALGGCSIWGYWARYGQYVIYVESFDLIMDAGTFRRIVDAYDVAIDARLRK
jgi:hypothetical protein